MIDELSLNKLEEMEVTLSFKQIFLMKFLGGFSVLLRELDQ